MPTFTEKYGPWAFIVGASMGIGAATLHEAAARGLNVLMLARGRTTVGRHSRGGEETATTSRSGPWRLT